MDSEKEIDPRLIQDIRILGLKQEINEAVGGKMTFNESESMAPELHEAFLENVLAFEKAPWTTHLDEMAREGLELPTPDDVPDDEMEALLWKVINKLAEIGCDLTDTNHLSDRELYTWLFEEGLREHVKAGIRGSWHTSPIGSCDEPSMLIHFRFYANEADRKSWMKQFPDYVMPPREKAPYDRDRHLPSVPIPHLELPDWGDDD